MGDEFDTDYEASEGSKIDNLDCADKLIDDSSCGPEYRSNDGTVPCGADIPDLQIDNAGNQPIGVSDKPGNKPVPKPGSIDDLGRSTRPNEKPKVPSIADMIGVITNEKPRISDLATPLTNGGKLDNYDSKNVEKTTERPVSKPTIPPRIISNGPEITNKPIPEPTHKPGEGVVEKPGDTRYEYDRPGESSIIRIPKTFIVDENGNIGTRAGISFEDLLKRLQGKTNDVNSKR